MLMLKYQCFPMLGMEIKEKIPTITTSIQYCFRMLIIEIEQAIKGIKF